MPIPIKLHAARFPSLCQRAHARSPLPPPTLPTEPSIKTRTFRPFHHTTEYFILIFRLLIESVRCVDEIEEAAAARSARAASRLLEQQFQKGSSDRIKGPLLRLPCHVARQQAP